jgi:hypothetical protein
VKRRKQNIKKTIQKKIELTNDELNNKPNKNYSKILNSNNVGLPKPKSEKNNLYGKEDIKRKKNNNPSFSQNRINRRTGNQQNLNKSSKNNYSFFNKKYIRKNNVDYDCTIIISSYNRFNKLYSLINQLQTQETNYSFKIIILNDGSTDNRYDSIFSDYNNVIYTKNNKNCGKKYYWKSINKLFDIIVQYKSHAVIQIDDDFILCNKFIDKLMNLFFQIKEQNNKYVAIHYHNSGNNLNSKRWGLQQWLDGGSLFDTYFLEAIEYKIDAIANRRWVRSENASSGVWMQISNKITKNSLKIYKTEISYALHNGNDVSMMNYELRKTKPIVTKNFINNG